MTEPMTLRVRVRTPVADVYDALTNARALRVWLAEHAEVDLPNRYEFWGRHTPDGDVPRQELLHVDDQTLRFSWRIDDTDTTVEFRVEPDGAQATILTIVHAGLPTFADMIAGAGTLGVLHTFWALSSANLVDHLEGRPLTPKCDFTSPSMREEFVIDASAQDVYDSIVDPDAFASWFGARIDLEPYVGGRWAMGGFHLDPSPAKILDLESGRKLSIAWDDGMTSTWELAESDGKTTLTFVQSGFDEQDPPYGSWMGWLGGFAELRRYHELPNWRPMWLEVSVDGMPEGMLTIE